MPIARATANRRRQSRPAGLASNRDDTGRSACRAARTFVAPRTSRLPLPARERERGDSSCGLDSLLRHLEPLKEHQIEVWTDREIKPGARWHDEIQNSLWRAKVAILMVSPAFLASAYIANNELPPLLRAASSEGLTIFWIPVMSSNYEQSEINQYQAAHPPSKPLSTLNAEECDEAFAAITSKLIEALGL